MARPKTSTPAPSTIRSRRQRERVKALDADRLDPLAEFIVRLRGAAIGDVIADGGMTDSSASDREAGGAELSAWITRTARMLANAGVEVEGEARRIGGEARRIGVAFTRPKNS